MFISVRDTRALGGSLAALPKIGESLTRATSAPLCRHREQISRLALELAPLSEEIVRSQREDAPLISREGGIYAGFFKLQSGGFIVE